MKYKEYTIYCKDHEELSGIVEVISAIGYDQLVISDPKDAEEIERESWGYTGSYADKSLIEELRSKASVAFYLGTDEKLLSEAEEFLRGKDYSMRIADDEDWLHKWEEYYVPFEIAPGIVVKPVWREYSRKEGELVVEIDPGLAFGTGSSPTTYLAARLLKEYIRECPSDPAGPKILDIGCGTGILSVIASKLGAASVLACDLDPEAIASTEKNASLNGCFNINVRENDLVNGIDLKADLITANLTGPLVLKLCENVARVCRPGTVLIASGIIDDMEEPCVKAIEGAGFGILKIVRDDCWSAIAAEFR